MSFPLAAPLRTALATFRQTGARCLSLIAMALLAARVMAAPVRAQSWSLKSNAYPVNSTVTGSFGSGAFTLNAVAPNAEYRTNGYYFYLDYEGESFSYDKLVTFTWSLKGGTLYPNATQFFYTLNGGEIPINQGGAGSGTTSFTLRAYNTIGFKLRGGDGAEVVVTSITVSDPPSVIDSLSLTSGSRSGGDTRNQVILSGRGFTPDSKVWFGETQAIIGYQNENLIYVNFPPAVATGDVNVTVRSGSSVSNAKTFTYTAAELSTNKDPPPIDASMEQQFTPVTPVKPVQGRAGEGTITYSITPIGASPSLSSLGLSLNTGTGEISAPGGKPTGVCAKCDYTITLTDGVPQTSSQKFQINVTAPRLVLPTQDQAYEFTYNTSGSASPLAGISGGFGTRRYTLVSGTLPTGLNFDGNFVISGTPTQLGSFPFIVQVADGGNSQELSFNVNVTAPPITPPGAATNQTMTYGVQASITPFIARGGYGTFTYTLKSGTLQQGLSFANGMISGKPTQLGDQQITITATDEVPQNQDYTFTLSVVAPAFAAANSAATPSFTVGVQGSFTAFATPTGSAGTVVYSISPALPAGVGLSFDTATGVISGKPLRVLTGAETKNFTITATDTGAGLSGRTANRQVTLSIAQGAVTVALAASSLTPKYGTPVTLTATVTGPGAAPEGSFDFMDGTEKLGTVAVSGGTASFTITKPLKAGPHAMKAVWSGDTNYVANSSAVVTVTSGRPDPTADKNVRAINALQVATVQRVATMQLDQVNRRLEMLHQDDIPGFVNGISVSAPQQMTGTPSAFDDPTKQDGLGLRNPAARALGDNLKIDDRMQARASDRSFGALETSRFKVWTAGSVIFGGVNVSSVGVVTKTHFTLASLTAGMDTKLMDDVKGGFAVSYSSDANDIGTDGSRLNSRSVAGSLYASWKLSDRVFLDGNLGYGGVSFDSKRFDGNAASFINGDRRGRMIFGSLSLSYDVKDGPLFYAPYARLDVIDATLNAYTESGDANWVLSYDRSTMGSKSAVLGLRGEYAIPQTWGTLSPTARVEYRRMLSGDVTQMMSYANEPGTTYSLTTTGADRDMFSGSLGLTARSTGDVTGAVEYVLSGGTKTGLQGQGLRGRLRVGF